jgi:cation:H+ antiporter
MQTVLLFWLGICLLSLVLIVKSAENALKSIIRFAEETKITYYFIGLFIISLGTSLPEIFTSVISSVEGNPQLVVGDAMGATIVDVTLVIGITLLMARRIRISKKEVNIVPWKIFFVIILPLLLAVDARLDRLDGMLLVLGFALYYIYHIVREFKTQQLKSYVAPSFVGKEMMFFGISIALLIFGVQLLVLSATNLSHILNIPSYIFGALVLGIATTSPEFIIELKAVRKHESTPIAFGDIFGSVLCNTSLVIGLSAIIRPITLDYFQFYSVGAFMLLAVIFSLWCIRKKELSWVMGVGMVCLYAVFVIVEITRLL